MAYRCYFGEIRPARVTVVSAFLGDGLLVQLDAIACKSQTSVQPSTKPLEGSAPDHQIGRHNDHLDQYSGSARLRAGAGDWPGLVLRAGGLGVRHGLR